MNTYNKIYFVLRFNPEILYSILEAVYIEKVNGPSEYKILFKPSSMYYFKNKYKKDFAKKFNKYNFRCYNLKTYKTDCKNKLITKGKRQYIKDIVAPTLAKRIAKILIGDSSYEAINLKEYCLIFYYFYLEHGDLEKQIKSTGFKYPPKKLSLITWIKSKFNKKYNYDYIDEYLIKYLDGYKRSIYRIHYGILSVQIISYALIIFLFVYAYINK